MKFVPSRVAAEQLGVCGNTLRSWADRDLIEYVKTAGRQRRYNVESYIGYQQQVRTICYCRVSSYKQKDDLQRQISFMRKNYPEAEIVKDIGSGINFKRKGLKTILESSLNGDKLKLVVAHKDRLCRFGFDLIEWLLQQNSGEIVVLDQSKLSPERELTEDLLTILHAFSSERPGLRRYKDEIDKTFSNKGAEKTV
ncbi:MAG: IS607 family transposase [Thermodesulfobacteriota bacterium]|nr:IS607 family transposase [Thermodesulfobacteriota bacterium]